MTLGDDPLDPDAARTYLHDWQQRIQDNAERARTVADRLATLRGSARDSNSLVEVTVDSAGALADVRFEPRSRGTAPETLSHAVLEAARLARRQVTERAQHLVTETLGPGSTTARAINEQIANRHD